MLHIIIEWEISQNVVYGMAKHEYKNKHSDIIKL